MSSRELYVQQAEFCKLMANPKRLEIINLISEQALCVEEIARAMEAHLPNISQHLALLRDQGVVEVTRKGTHLYYKLNDPQLFEACCLMRQAVIGRMENQAQILKTLQEETGDALKEKSEKS